MDNALALLEQGRAGMLTLFGMGGVFLALLLLYLFTSVLGKATSLKRAETSPAGQKAPETPATPGSVSASASAGADGAGRRADPSADEQLAALIAVAVALEHKQPTAGLAEAAEIGSQGRNAWRLAGRLQSMTPWKPMQRDGLR